MGAGQTLTILYEINSSETVNSTSLNNAMKLDIRYKDPSSNKSKLVSHNISSAHNEKLSDDFTFISSVVETAMILNKSKYLGNTSINTVRKQLASISLSNDKQEFLTLVEKLASNNKNY